MPPSAVSGRQYRLSRHARARRTKDGIETVSATLWQQAVLFFLLGATVALAIPLFRMLFNNNKNNINNITGLATITTTAIVPMFTATPAIPFEAQTGRGKRKLNRELYGPSYVPMPSDILVSRLISAFLEDCLAPVMTLLDELGINAGLTLDKRGLTGTEEWWRWGERTPFHLVEGKGKGKGKGKEKGEGGKGEKGTEGEGKGGKPHGAERSDIERLCRHLRSAADAETLGLPPWPLSSSADAASENNTHAEVQAARARDLLLRACEALPSSKRQLRGWAGVTDRSFKWLDSYLDREAWPYGIRMFDIDAHYAPLVLEPAPDAPYIYHVIPLPVDIEYRLGLEYQMVFNELTWRGLRRGLCAAQEPGGEDDGFESGAGPPWVTALRGYAADLVMLRRDLETLWDAILFARTQAEGEEEPFLVWLQAEMEKEDNSNGPPFQWWVPLWMRSFSPEEELERRQNEAEKRKNERKHYKHFSLSTLDAAIKDTHIVADKLDGVCADLAVLYANEWQASSLGYPLPGRIGDTTLWTSSSASSSAASGQEGEKEDKDSHSNKEKEHKKQKEGKEEKRKDNAVMIWTLGHVKDLGIISQRVMAVLGPLVQEWGIYM